MFEHALLGVDPGDRDQSMIERVAAAASAFGFRRVTLVHALDPTVPGALEEATDETRAQQRVRELEDLGRPLADAGIEVDATVRKGAPAWALQEAASDLDVDCIVMLARGHSAVSDFFLGSALLDSARITRFPLLVLPENGTIPEDGPILVGTDGSDAARPAEQLALKLASGSRSLIAVYVPQSMQPSGWRAKESERAKAQLKELEGLGADARVEPGYPWQVLTSMAKQEKATAIVVGQRGFNALEALLLGSSAEAVCRRAENPVVLVPKPSA